MLVVDATFNFAVSQIQSTAHISRTTLRTKSGLHEHAIDKQAKIESMKLLGELNFELAATYAARTVFDIGNFSGQNAEKCRPEKLRIRTLVTQCLAA